MVESKSRDRRLAPQSGLTGRFWPSLKSGGRGECKVSGFRIYMFGDRTVRTAVLLDVGLGPKEKDSE